MARHIPSPQLHLWRGGRPDGLLATARLDGAELYQRWSNGRSQRTQLLLHTSLRLRHRYRQMDRRKPVTGHCRSVNSCKSASQRKSDTHCHVARANAAARAQSRSLSQSRCTAPSTARRRRRRYFPNNADCRSMPLNVYPALVEEPAGRVGPPSCPDQPGRLLTQTRHARPTTRDPRNDVRTSVLPAATSRQLCRPSPPVLSPETRSADRADRRQSDLRPACKPRNCRRAGLV
jgi:hypothetical protein